MRHWLLATVLLALAPIAGRAAPLVIAPHIAGEVFCPAAVDNLSILEDEQAWGLCAARGQNAAKQLTAFLNGIGPKLSPSGKYALGYTLGVPVLGLYTRQPTGWQIDPKRIDTLVSLIGAVDRPVVLYLSANHFTDAGVVLAKELAADPRNLMWTRSGPMQAGGYFNVGLDAWTLADMQAPVTKLREDGFHAVLDAVCNLPPAARSRIAGVDVLGEVHQLFAGFPDKMGYADSIEISDYSPASVAGFRHFLARRFPSIAALNTETGFDFTSFETIDPPAHDLQHENLRGFAQELDSHAAGTLTLQGWAYDDAGDALTVSAWIDGKKWVQAPVWFNRLDVTDALPGLRSPNVGWQLPIDYHAIPFGIHVIDVLLSAPGHKDVRVAQRHVVVDDRARDTPPKNDFAGVAASGPDIWPGLHATMDTPGDWVALFYNPLARLWQDWREAQIRDYITHFARIVDQSCLGPDLVFSHQINPRLNSSWNADLLGVAASEAPSSAYHPGTTLYGGAAFGDAFFDMARQLDWNDYAVAELHPVFDLTLPAMEAMLERHRLAGARYVAPYYMSMKPARLETNATTLAKRMLRPGNPVQGSGTFYAAIQDLMAHK